MNSNISSNVSNSSIWNLPVGTKITALYCGRQVQGAILDMRVKYGGRIGITLELTHAVSFDWSGSDKKAGDAVLIEDKDVLKVG